MDEVEEEGVLFRVLITKLGTLLKDGLYQIEEAGEGHVLVSSTALQDFSLLNLAAQEMEELIKRPDLRQMSEDLGGEENLIE